ncbi:uncharacterized conserved protein [Nitrobacter hamburgensis X14]|uniref:Uncharacterized conserved protein n=1 Tax=Nitrobacter hamburgensis (strain DSM 10229 / NCIMB 13809 / X14) TaxID=323097 RepID=Q1QRD9_NITHX|nr:hypothetical protein [Nitrobacter hamburgensis]ABE61208.1 uncharacterized conserved protein [Nitrobacter hamburgensis X14]
MDVLKQEFQVELFNAYKRAKDEAKYHATIFIQMLTDRGGLETAKFLINSPKVSDGYTALYERERLDLTVEAIVAENSKWHPLFTTEEIDRCHKRLAQYGYTPRLSKSS